MTTQTTPRHQVSVATAQMRDVADGVVGASVWSMDPVETVSNLVELARLKSQIGELEARVAAHADEIQIGDASGATSTGNWLAHATKQTRPDAARVVRFGHDLDTHTLVRDALAAGGLLVDQAVVIIRAVNALPDDLDPDLVARAEAHLVAEAADHDSRALKILGRRLLDVVAPEIADQHEADLLEKEERDAAAACRLTMTDDGHGKVYGRFTLPALQAAALKKMLLALAAPKHVAATEGAGVERRPSPERMGRAFCELIDTITAKDLPTMGGTDATIVVTMSYESLAGRVERVGVLDTGQRLSPSAVRMMACTARIIPAVLGSDSEVLDLGRKRRLFSKAQRTALGIRDGSCTAEGCDWPPGLCHAHHDQHWSRGGPSDLTNARLLCPRHHARAHDPTYDLQKLDTGKVAFTRRQ